MIAELRVEPGTDARLDKRPTDDKLGLADKDDAATRLAALHPRLFDLQERLWAEAQRALLVVLQAVDAGGKDGTIRSVFSGVNPQGVRVVSFKVPAGREARQDYLWRVHANCPSYGEIGIFNRSHYEDVVAVRVHELLPEKQWRQRYHHIAEFERLLADEGTRVVKIFLHISKEEQRERLQARIDDPNKNWKFRAGDLEDRARWDGVMAAYEDAITKTSTDWAPWYVVPGDRKWVRDVAVSTLLVETLEDMDPQYPPPEAGLGRFTLE